MQKKFPLSPRIQLIVDHVIPNEPFWDLCCDHGYIGIGALTYKDVSEVHFVDQVPHIIEKIQSYSKSTQTPLFYHTSPAENLTEQFSGTVVICGVGMNTIQDVLVANQKNKKSSIQRWIIGPHTHQDVSEVLSSLLTNYKLFQKTSVLERGRTRDFYIFDQNY